MRLPFSLTKRAVRASSCGMVLGSVGMGIEIGTVVVLLLLLL